MKIKPPIPKCKQCGCDLYAEEKFYYDRRKKYCDVCAEERKRDSDARRMKAQRTERKDARTKQIESLKAQVEEQAEQIELLISENKSLRNKIIEGRFW